MDLIVNNERIIIVARVIYGEEANWEPQNKRPEDLTYDEKIAIIAEFAESKQPTPNEFRGIEGFPKAMINSDIAEVQRRERRFANKSIEKDSDNYGMEAEPLVATLLDDNFLPTRKRSRAFLASRYDDVENQTDVAFCVSDKEGEGFSTFAIQIATTTSLLATREKFNKSANGKNTPPMTMPIRYCKLQDRKWSEPISPHFILGLSPGGVRHAVSKIKIADDYESFTREPDPMTNFMLLSEMYEQIKMQQLALKQQPADDAEKLERATKLSSLNSAVVVGLYKIMEIDTKLPKEQKRDQFKVLYPKLVDTCRRTDEVYKNIIAESDRRTALIRGSSALAGYNISAS